MDKIDAALKAAQPEQPKPVSVQVRLSSGRLVAILVPADLGSQEAIDLMGYIATQLPNELAKHRGVRARILVPARA